MTFCPRRIDPSAEAGHRRAFAKRGIRITVERISGMSPATVSFFAEVTALVQNYTPDGAAASRTGYGAGAPGGISQGDRTIIVMATDLAERRFPLPLAKNDRITLVTTGERLNVVKVDPDKRAMAGAIELTAAGVP
ncbi:hypothetical protein [Methylovirgula sp. HY1]|uniref:hypothetical protein n=1 Tax=Methylovirgula sp. HY1 TaxID=2822761 RepID=UPI001C5A6332|nr:hypothetical protein [Methylovirgula sp. HY1]QXX74241.1 hypothetical protein MHY1_01051 [Methylovirgula sp. HY1]